MKIIYLLVLVSGLSGCAGMSPESEAFWIRTGDKAVDTAIVVVRPTKVEVAK